MSKTAKQILTETRELLRDKQKWTQGAYRTNTIEPHKGQFCLIGAVRQCAGYYSRSAINWYYPYIRAVKALEECLPVRPPQYREEQAIIAYNDREHAKHEDIMQMLDCAVEKADDNS